MTIQYRYTLNKLTAEPSYATDTVPMATADIEDIVNDINTSNPTYSKNTIRGILTAQETAIRNRILNGENVNLSGLVSFSTSIPGRVDDIESTRLPSALRVNATTSSAFVASVRNEASLSKLPTSEKSPAPVLQTHMATGMNYYLDGEGGISRVSGSQLAFDSTDTSVGIFATSYLGDSTAYRSTNYGSVTNTEAYAVIAHETGLDKSQNEFFIAVKCRYTTNGTVRTGNLSKPVRAKYSIVAADYNTLEILQVVDV